MTTLEMTVGQLVAEKPARARVFEKHGIDYCCGGKKPLSIACQEKNVSIDQVVRDLDAAEQHDRNTVEQNWLNRTMTELTRHIEQTHHAYLKQELPRLDMITKKVAAVHGENHPEMVQVREIFVGFKAELESHMMKEEMILFPLCRQFEQEGAAEMPVHCGSVQNPIRVMIAEHDDAGHALEQFRTLTNDYTPPADACNTFRALVDSLRQLEADMHQHVHKENNILFPRAVEVEASRRR
jgi:regulator of cell morphogenesis and NO signaling